MKNSIFIIIFFYLSNVFSQTEEIGTDLFNGQASENKDMVVTGSGEVYLAMSNSSNDGEIEVYHYDGVNWTNIANSGTFIDSLCGSFKLLYNSLNDSLFLGYVKDDGFYLRSYGTSWSSAEIFTGTVSTNWQDDRMLGAIDEENNTSYFIYADSFSSSKLLKFNSNTALFTELSVPIESNNQLDKFDLVFNSEDGFLYFSFATTSSTKIERYNGIGWSNLDDNIFDLQGYSLQKSKLVHVQGENEVLCFYCYEVGFGENRIGIKKYNCATNESTVVLSEEVVAASLLKGAALKNSIYYVDFSIIGHNGLLNGSSFSEDLNPEWRSDYYFDDQGYLYWRNNVGTTENVYRSGPFVLGKMDLDPELNSLIYPNPATNQIQITSDELNSVSFFSIDGALVAEGYEVSKSQPLNIDFLSKGLYIVKLVAADGEVNQQRIVVE